MPLTLQDIMTSTLLITIMVTILTTPITRTAESIPNVEIMREMEGQTPRIKKTNQKEKMMTKTNLHFKMNLYVLINILWIHYFFLSSSIIVDAYSCFKKFNIQAYSKFEFCWIFNLNLGFTYTIRIHENKDPTNNWNHQ